MWLFEGQCGGLGVTDMSCEFVFRENFDRVPLCPHAGHLEGYPCGEVLRLVAFESVADDEDCRLARHAQLWCAPKECDPCGNFGL